MICLVFENCDHIDLPDDSIKEAKISVMPRIIDPTSKEIPNLLDYVYFVLDKEKIKDLATNFYESFKDSHGESREKFLLIPRLQDYQDITQIQVIEDSNSDDSITYHVHWHDEDEYSNRYQTVEETNDSIIIKIDSREERPGKQLGTPSDHMWALEKSIEYAKQFINLDKEHPGYMNEYSVEQLRALMNSTLELIERDFKKVKENSRLLEPVSHTKENAIAEAIINSINTTKVTINGIDDPNVPIACRFCRQHPLNGGTGICHCTIGVQPLTM